MDFLKKYNLKNDTMTKSDLQEFINTIYTPEILK